MRLLKLVPLLALPVFFLGATCVTHVEQKGPAGPWVGEVTNTGTDPVGYVYTHAQVFDASGQSLGDWGSQACPLTLSPGETGVFELLLPADYRSELAVKPLRAEFDALAQSSSGPAWDGSRGGLAAQLIEKDPARGYALVEITNSSPRTYRALTICAVLRTPDGRPAAVASASPFPSVLRPGEKVRTVMSFDPMLEGFFEFFPSGDSQCCSSEVVLDPSSFRITAKKVVSGPQGRELQVVGELDNASGQDLTGVELEAHLEHDPASSTRVSVGCDGMIGYASKGSAAFSLPLKSGDQPSVVIGGVQGYGGGGEIYRVPVSATSMARRDSDILVSATLSNPTDKWLNLWAVCLDLRGPNGALVGNAQISVEAPPNAFAPYLAPGAEMRISGAVTPLVFATSADAVAYAYVSDEPPSE